MVQKFLIVYEKTKSGYSAYSPDITGCVATGSTKKQTEKNIYSAIESHLKGMLDDGTPLPLQQSASEYIIINEKKLTTTT